MPREKQITLSKDKLRERYDQIQSVYLADQYPWIIGYSGGKDSTTTLQMVWIALSELPREKLTKKIFVITSDTLVEPPKIVEFVDGSLEKINLAATEQGLPITAEKVLPEIDESFWVNLIGRGYPTPTKTFRWCTERLKIKPANRFILDQVGRYGEAIVVLGARESESATRAQVLANHRNPKSPLNKHSSLVGAYVYAPIFDFTLDDVWTYLLQVPSPWGANNRDLVTLYRNAQAGECPLVIDTSTPSCGNSRFGCWVCTVVDKDSSMEAMIENGEEWMEPLLTFRDELAVTRDPKVKRQVRDFKRRNGRVTVLPDGRIVPGPYKPEFRKELLRRLLKTQISIQQNGPNPDEELITKEEMEAIRRIWRSEIQDWQDSVPQIYQEVMGESLGWDSVEQPGFSREDRIVLEPICDRKGVRSDKVAKLLDKEREFHGMSRRSGVYDVLAKVLNEDWRSEEEVRSGLPNS